MSKTAWEEFKTPTDGPMPTGYVRVAGVRLPIRIFILGGTVIPVPWGPEVEQPFRRWFRSFALAKGWSTNPDHDKYSVDWRAAWYCGIRNIIDDELKTTSGRMPEEKLATFERTVNKLVVAR